MLEIPKTHYAIRSIGGQKFMICLVRDKQGLEYLEVRTFAGNDAAGFSIYGDVQATIYDKSLIKFMLDGAA